MNFVQKFTHNLMNKLSSKGSLESESKEFNSLRMKYHQYLQSVRHSLSVQ